MLKSRSPPLEEPVEESPQAQAVASRNSLQRIIATDVATSRRIEVQGRLRASYASWSGALGVEIATVDFREFTF